jgi:RNA polymerase sigma-70 factor (ECF subfamily)
MGKWLGRSADAGTPSYEEILISAEQEEHTKQRLKQGLEQLTPRQMELIQMRFFEEMSNEAISQQAGMHINKVYNTISSALKTLRQAMEESDGSSLSGWWPLLLLLWQSAEKMAGS